MIGLPAACNNAPAVCSKLGGKLQTKAAIGTGNQDSGSVFIHSALFFRKIVCWLTVALPLLLMTGCGNVECFHGFVTGYRQFDYYLFCHLAERMRNVG